MSITKAAIVALALTFGTVTTAPFFATEAAAADQRVAKKKKKVMKKVKKGKKKVKRVKRAKVMKSCGTYKYRKGGKCLDARNKK